MLKDKIGLMVSQHVSQQLAGSSSHSGINVVNINMVKQFPSEEQETQLKKEIAEQNKEFELAQDHLEKVNKVDKKEKIMDEARELE